MGVWNRQLPSHGAESRPRAGAEVVSQFHVCGQAL